MRCEVSTTEPATNELNGIGGISYLRQEARKGTAAFELLSAYFGRPPKSRFNIGIISYKVQHSRCGPYKISFFFPAARASNALEIVLFFPV